MKGERHAAGILDPYNTQNRKEVGEGKETQPCGKGGNLATDGKKGGG